MTAALSGLADLIQRLLDELLSCVELIISDHAGKRPRRSHRLITQRVYQRARPAVYHVHYHQVPVRRPL